MDGAAPFPPGVIVAIVSFLVTHLGAALWFGSKIQTKVDMIREDIARMASSIERLSKDLHAADRVAVNHDARLEEIERRVSDLEGQRRLDR